MPLLPLTKWIIIKKLMEKNFLPLIAYKKEKKNYLHLPISVGIFFYHGDIFITLLFIKKVKVKNTFK